MTHLTTNLSIYSNLSYRLIIVCLSTTLGTSVPVGIHLSVINAPADFIKTWCNETLIDRYDVMLSVGLLETLWASIVSIFLLGGAIGALCGAWVADKFGRKKTLLAIAILFTAGAILFVTCRYARSVEMLLIARLLVGLASGLTTSVCPMYLAEVAPQPLRGPAAVLISMGMILGILIGQIISLPEVLGSKEYWEYALSSFVLLVMLCIIPYPWFSESPKFLYIISDKKERARKELISLRGNDIKMVDDEIAQMENEAILQSERRSFRSVVTDRTLLLPLCLVCIIQVGHQLSGINAVIYYSVSMFELAGLSSTKAKWVNVVIGCVSFGTAAFTPFIMGKYSRRNIILSSTFLSGLFLTLVAVMINLVHLAYWIPYASIVSVLCFIFSFEFGLGPIAFFIASELFESAPRPVAMALGSLTSWTFNIIVGMTFPILQLKWGAYVFIPYAIACFMLFIFLKIYLPETRNQDPSKIAVLLRDGFKSKPNE